MKKLIILLSIIILPLELIAGIFFYLTSEIEIIQTFIPNTMKIISSHKNIALTIYDKDNNTIYEDYITHAKQLPKHYNLEKLRHLVDFLVQDKALLTSKASSDIFSNIFIKLIEAVILHKYKIDKDSLQNIIAHYYTNELIADRKDLPDVSKYILTTLTLDRLYKNFTQDQLRIIFLNNAQYAENVFGLESASEHFFNKDLTHISNLEICFLLSLIRFDGSYLLPEKDYQEISRKARNLFNKLYENNYIEESEYRTFTNLELMHIKKKNENISYTKAVINRLNELENTRYLIGREEIKAYTGYNPRANAIAREEIDKFMKRYPKDFQIAFVLANYKTAQVEVAIGSKVESSEVNRAITVSRQMASTFKPIVYLSALSKGFRGSDIIFDKPYSFNIRGQYYSPRNYEDTFLGRIPLRYGLIYSLNNATIKLGEDVGLQYVRNMAVSLGMKGNINPFHAMTIGVFPTTPLNVAQIYSTIANMGKRQLPELLSHVEINGEYYSTLEEPKQVVSKEAAYQLLYIMQDVARRGTTRSANLAPGTASKTGTSNDVRDVWTVAIFGDYVLVIWIGKDNLTSLSEDGAGGSMVAPLIGNFQRAYFGKDVKFNFERPSSITLERVDKRSGKLSSRNDANTYIEAYDRKNLPNDSSVKEYTAVKTGSTKENKDYKFKKKVENNNNKKKKSR